MWVNKVPVEQSNRITLRSPRKASSYAPAVGSYATLYTAEAPSVTSPERSVMITEIRRRALRPNGIALREDGSFLTERWGDFAPDLLGNT
jgi:hypothetical protein